MALNIIQTINNVKREMREQKESSIAEKKRRIAEQAAQAGPEVIEGASVKLPTGDADVDVAKSIVTDLRGKNVDIESQAFENRTRSSISGLTRTEPTVREEQPEELDEITRIDETIRKQILAGKDPKEVLINEQQQRGTVLPDGTVDYSREAADAVITKELENQRLRAFQTTPESYDDWLGTGGVLSEKTIKNQLGLNANASADELTILGRTAINLNDTIAKLLPDNLNDLGNPSIIRLRNLLSSYDLIEVTTDNKVIPKAKFGNALAIQLIETFNDEIVKRDKSRQEDDFRAEFDRRQMSENGSAFDNTLSMGTAFNPDYTRGNLVRGLLNKLVINPNEDVQTGIVTGRGGSGDQVLSDTNKPESEVNLDAIMDQILWNIVGANGFLKPVTITDPDTGAIIDQQYKISKTGEEYFANTRGLLAKLQPDKREDVSYARPIIGQVIASKAREYRDRGPISIKSEFNKNLTKENRVKDKLGAIPLKIVKERLSYGEKLVRDIIIMNDNNTDVAGLANMPTKTIEKMVEDPAFKSEVPPGFLEAKRKQELNKRRMLLGQPIIPLNAQEEEVLQYTPIMKTEKEIVSSNRFYSMNPYADALGLDEDHWMESFNNAIGKAQADGETDPQRVVELATNQANAVMKSKAKDIVRDLEDAKRNIGKVFYNKYFHASSVGRYFVRQQVLNAMNSKFVRNIVGSAQPKAFDLSKKMSRKESDIFESWKYIIGKNLLESGQIIVPTNQMGWNAIVNRIDTIIEKGYNGSKVYKDWVDRGRELKKILADDTKTTADITKVIGPKDLKSFQKKQDEWGFKLQSYIDFYNYHEARKAKRLGTGNTKFTVEAQSSADGIQSGIAIQAMQNGDTDILKLVGAIYNTEENILPEGDIRDKFYETMVAMPEVAFTESKEKMAFWADFIKAIEASGNKAAIKKDLAKQPLMETSYGRSIKFNHAALIKFLGKHGEIYESAKNKNQASIYKGPDGDAIFLNDFNKLMALSLMNTLRFGHQKTLSNLGLSWSFLDMTGYYEGPFGTTQFVGSKEVVSTGNEIEINVNDPEIAKALGQESFTVKELKSIPTGSAMAGSGLSINVETGAFEQTPTTRFGQESANQFVVLPIQQIDAAVLGNTIDKVNDSATMLDNNGYPLFVFTVHDSITADANSMRQYHRGINAEFKSLNKEYKLQRALVNGFTDGLTRWNNSINNNKDYTLSSFKTGDMTDLNSHRSLHSFFLQMENSIKKEKSPEVSTREKLTGTTKFTKSNREKVIEEAKALGWAAEGGMVKGRNLKRLVQLAVDHMNVISELKQWEANAIKERRGMESILARLIYNYN